MQPHGEQHNGSPQTDQPRALTPMVPAGQWQAVKDTLSRPNGRSLTTSGAFGNTSTLLTLMLQSIPESYNLMLQSLHNDLTI